VSKILRIILRKQTEYNIYSWNNRKYCTKTLDPLTGGQLCLCALRSPALKFQERLN